MADNVQLQGIEFQITGSAKNAGAGLKTLTNNLKKLREAVSGGIGLKSVAEELSAFNADVEETDPGKIRETANAVSALARAVDKLSAAGAKLGGVSSQLHDIAGINFSNLADAAANMKELRQGLPKMPTTPSPSSTPAGEAPVDMGTTEVAPGQAVPAAEQLEEIAKASEGLKFSLKDTAAVLTKVVLGPTLINPLKDLGSTLRSVTGAFTKFASSIGRIAMYRAVRAAIAAFTKGLKEGIGYLNLYSKQIGTQFHRSLNILATDALYLKNSLATVAAPIVNAIAPAIDYLTDKIAAALNMVAQLFSKLSGKSVYTRAIKYGTEYADSMSNAANKMKDFTAGFDELNIFNDNAGSGNNLAQNAGQMFEEAVVESDVGGFASRIREAFLSGDWAKLGTELGKKINSVFASIDWSGIGSSFGKKVGAVVTTAYNLLRTIDFRAIGFNISQTINSFLAEINFEEAGRLMARKTLIIPDLIIGALAGLDWRLIGQSVDRYISGSINEYTMWLESVDWGQIGKSLFDALYNLIASINWLDLIMSLAHFVSEATYKSAELIVGFLWAPFEKAYKYITGESEVSAGDIVDGLWSGIKKALSNVVQKLKTNLVDPFINAFKSLFGIASPSTVMEEQGTFLIDGLFKGISETWPKIKTFFADSLANLKRDLESKWDEMKRDASYKWSEIKSDLSLKWEGIKTAADEKFGGVKDTIHNVWSELTRETDTDWSDISNFLSTTWGLINANAGDIFSQVRETIGDIWSDIRDDFEDIANGIIDILNWVIDGFNNLMYIDFDGFSIMGQEIVPSFSVQLAELPNIPYLAGGGVVDSGQLFIARENGAEMVGRIGSQTGVANNDQIEAGIAMGVSAANEAVVAAIYDLLDAVNEKDLSVTIGDNDIGMSYDRYNRNRGLRVNTGAFANAY